ncbi:MAG TPA: hypothetical protein PLN21_00940 [Gemmatales bacterium]|nr:hypothetical protein [Gemmatales bacterium]
MKSGSEYYGKAYSWLYTTKNDACKWVGTNVFDVKVIVQPTGSGDTMRNYVGCFCAGVIAAALTLAWTLIALSLQLFQVRWQLDRCLHQFTRVVVRFFLIQMLFGYGFAKVFPLQFSPPSAFRLVQPLGEMSPMGLLWTFMGYSTPYQMFTGAVEVLGGLLLVTRRTTLLGALVTAGAMTQIFALNMCFDVPVKLYSLHYLVMALFLAAPDLPRLWNAIVLGRAVEAKPYPPLFGNVWLDRFGVLFRTLLVGAWLYNQIMFGYENWAERYSGPPAPVQGQWEVTSMLIDDKEVDKEDVLRWKSLDFSNKSMVRFSFPKPPMMVYKTTWDADEQKLTLGKFTTPMWSAEFIYQLPQSDKLVLEGKMDGKSIKATLKPMPVKEYQLTTRGFNWIQEMPYNR